MRILVIGQRVWWCHELAATILLRLVARYGLDVMIALGDDTGVEESFVTAKELRIRTEGHPADFDRLGEDAELFRNRETIWAAEPDSVSSCIARGQPRRQGLRPTVDRCGDTEVTWSTRTREDPRDCWLTAPGFCDLARSATLPPGPAGRFAGFHCRGSKTVVNHRNSSKIFRIPGKHLHPLNSKASPIPFFDSLSAGGHTPAQGS